MQKTDQGSAPAHPLQIDCVFTILSFWEEVIGYLMFLPNNLTNIEYQQKAFTNLHCVSQKWTSLHLSSTQGSTAFL